MPPTRLGPYEIGEALGKGGMGCVYRAVNVETGEKVAVKVLSPQLAMAEGFRGRFEAEIDSLKTLRHGGIVRLYGWGEEQGSLFYSMELVEGTSLEEELKAGRRFNWREVVDIAIQMCKALKHAHDHGVIHRDIKPANILIDSRERVKLADFGIARLFGGTQLTSAGGVLGTADYMSPEQADGRPVTARCDQYSLGGVMYALLAGRPPFRARSLPEMLQLQRFAEPESVRRYAPQTPEQVEQAIQQLLAKDPANRFPNVMVLARHLEAMTIALSRPTQDDFDLPEESEPRPHFSSDPSQSLAATQADPQQMTAAGVLPTRSATTPPSGNGDSVSMLLAGSEQAKSKPGAEPEIEVLTSRFTTVEEEEAQKHTIGRDSPWTLIGQWGGLLAILAALAGGIWYASQPPSADQLYNSVQSAIDNDESLGSVSRDIEQFLERFPKDERFEEMSAYQRQLELDRMGRRLRLNSRRNASGDQSMLAIERLYLESMELAPANPQRAAAKLQQLIALFDDAGDAEADDPKQSQRIADFLALARQQLTELRQRSDQFAESELAELQSRLAAAQKLAQENPERAKGISTAIVELYGDQPWAAPVVNEANALLEELGNR